MVEVFVLPVDPVEREEAVFDPVFIPVAEEKILAPDPLVALIAVPRGHPEERRKEGLVLRIEINGNQCGPRPEFVPVKREDAERSRSFLLQTRLFFPGVLLCRGVYPPDGADEIEPVAEIADRDDSDAPFVAEDRPGEPEIAFLLSEMHQGEDAPEVFGPVRVQRPPFAVPDVHDRDDAEAVLVPVRVQRPAVAVDGVPRGEGEQDGAVVALLVEERADRHAEIVPVDEWPQHADVTAVHGAERPDVDLAVLQPDGGAEIDDGVIESAAGNAAGLRRGIGIGIPADAVHAFAGGARRNEQGRENCECGEEGCFQVARIHGGAFRLYQINGVERIRVSVNISYRSINFK